MDTVRVAALGWKARDALAASGGAATVLATLSESVYVTAADQVLWCGAGGPLHARAMLAAAPVRPGRAPDGPATLRFDLAAARLWTPPAPPAASVPGLAAAARALCAAVGSIGAPEGFGALLAGRAPAFPLDGAVGAALALARACAAGDPDAAATAAEALIGLGPGLTPAGDDYVGGAFFARALLGARPGSTAAPAPGGAGRPTPGADGWARAAARIRARARRSTHPISAALLDDLCAGSGHAPLHDLAGALAAGGPPGAAVEAARRLVRLGHSSGWDLLAGLLAGLGGLGAARGTSARF